MQVVTLKRKEMIPQIEAAHIGAMIRLRRAYPTPAAQSLLNLADTVSVEISERMLTCAGNARIRRRRNSAGEVEHHAPLIRLNARLHAINQDELIPTYLHELAHIVADLLLGKCAKHGPTWRSVMANLGIKDEVYHKMDVSAFRAPRKKFLYICVECDRQFHLTSHRHAKSQRRVENYGVGSYRCPCSGDIYWRKE